MRLLKNDDYQLIERIVGATQKELLHTLHKYLQDKYKNVIKTKDYIQNFTINNLQEKMTQY